MIYSVTDAANIEARVLNRIEVYGDLVEFLGCNMAKTDDVILLEACRQIRRGEIADCVTVAHATNRDGDVKKVKCFLWYDDYSKGLRGLIVDMANKQDLKDAKAEYTDFTRYSLADYIY